MNKQKKIKYNHLLFIVTLLLAVLFLLIASFHTLIRQNLYLISESKSKTQGEFNQKYQTIYERFKKASNICDYINSILPDLWDFSQSDSKIPYMEKYENIRDQLTKTVSYNNFIDEIIVVSDTFTIASYSNRNVIYQYGREIMDSLVNEYDKFADEKNNTQIIRAFYPSSENEVGFIKGEYGIQKPIYKEDRLAGWIIVIFNESVFEGFADKGILILNENNDRIYGDESVYKDYANITSLPNTGEITTEIEVYETRNQFVMKKKIIPTQLSISMVSGAGQTNKISNYIPFIATAVISLILAILLSKMASNHITVPLRVLKKNVDNYNLHKSKNIQENFSSGKAEKKLSFRESILIYLIIVLFVPSALFIFSSYMLSLSNINNRIRQSNMTSVEWVVNNINVYLEDKQKVLRIIIYDDFIQDKLYSQINDEEFGLNINRALIMGGHKNPIKIYDRYVNEIYTNDNSSAGYSLPADEVDEIMGNREIYKWNSTQTNSYNEYEYSILVKINSLEHFENIGYLKSWIPESELEDIYEDLSDAGIIINIIDENNRIVSSKNKELIDSEYIGNADPEYEEHVYPLQYGDWTLIAKYGKSISSITKNSLILEKLYLLILILLITIVVAFVISFYMTKWITLINKLINKTRFGGKSIDFPENFIIYEFAQLSKSFNEMINANKKLADQIIEATKLAVELEELGKKSELKALQFQINSHFIYNTFDGIIWLIKSNKQNAAVQMLTYLSKFLRYVARTDSPIVKVDEEIAHVKNYISLIKMRFNRKIKFYWDIDKNVLEYQTIRLSVQPIIENAIFHGIYPACDVGIVEISSYRDDDFLYISVSDDGCGIHEEKLQDLLQNMNAQEAKNSIGLHNIQSRIKLYFGEKYGLEITSKVNAGTNVTIKLPLRVYKEIGIPSAATQNN